MTSDLQTWARNELENPAVLTNREISEWAEAAFKRGDAGGTARLEIVRVLREMCYTQVNQPTERQSLRIPTDTYALARAEAILDTPINQLASMIVMSDTVLGNWRTIAATLVPA